MEEIVFKFEVLDESFKQKVVLIVWEFPGVTSIKFKEEGKVKVKGEFDKFEMKKQLKKIDETVEIFEVGLDGVAEQEVDQLKHQKQGGDNQPINQEKVNKSSHLGSSKWPTLEGIKKLWFGRGNRLGAGGPINKGKEKKPQPKFGLPQQRQGNFARGGRPFKEELKKRQPQLFKRVVNYSATRVARFFKKAQPQFKQQGRVKKPKPQFWQPHHRAGNPAFVDIPFKQQEQLNKRQPQLWKRVTDYTAKRVAGFFKKAEPQFKQPQQGGGNHACVGRPIRKEKVKKPEPPLWQRQRGWNHARVDRPFKENEQNKLQPQFLKRAVNYGAGRVTGFFKQVKVNEPQFHFGERLNPYVNEPSSNASSSEKPTRKTQNSEGETTQGSTTVGKTKSVWNTWRFTLSNGQANTSTQTLSTGQANTSTQVQRSAQTNKKKSTFVARKGKNGK